MTICELLTLLPLEYIGDLVYGGFLLRVIARRNGLEIGQSARSLLFKFARMFCADLDLPATLWGDTVAAQIRAQLEDQDGVGNVELAVGKRRDGGDEVPKCRVVLSVRPIVSFPSYKRICSSCQLTRHRSCTGG